MKVLFHVILTFATGGIWLVVLAVKHFLGE